MQKEDKIKEGDKIHDSLYGWGVVYEMEESSYVVKFLNKTIKYKSNEQETDLP